MKLTLDCKSFTSKLTLLAEIQKIFDEMYALNYDSLIDGARGYENELEISIDNISCYEDEQNLREVLDIISQENPQITITY